LESCGKGLPTRKPQAHYRLVDKAEKHRNFLSKEAMYMAELIRVSAQSRSTAVAGAIAGVMREQEQAEMQAIGASAVNQAIKAVAIARGYLEQDNIDLVIVPTFTEVEIEGNERTAVRITVYRRPSAMTPVQTLNGNGVASLVMT